MTKPNTLHVRVGGVGLDAVKLALKRLAQESVLVGVPAAKATRTTGDEAETINNATIGYLNEFGMPEANIPERPWLMPPVRDHHKEIGQALARAAKSALDPNQKFDFDQRMNQVGLRTVNYIKAHIRAGIQPPLAQYTLEQRAARGRRGAKQELANRKAGVAASVLLAKPLIDTGAFLASISFVFTRVNKGP